MPLVATQAAANSCQNPNQIRGYLIFSILEESGIASIKRAMDFWQSNTCVTFRLRTDEDEYVLFTGTATRVHSS